MSYAIMTRLPYGEVILLLLHHLLFNDSVKFEVVQPWLSR